MRRLAHDIATLGAAIAATATLGAATASSAWADYVPTSGNGTLTASDVCVGSPATFAADGFGPNSTVTVTVGTAAAVPVAADAAGKASYEITPSVAGTYTVTATGVTPPPGDA